MQDSTAAKIATFFKQSGGKQYCENTVWYNCMSDIFRILQYCTCRPTDRLPDDRTVKFIFMVIALCRLRHTERMLLLGTYKGACKLVDLAFVVLYEHCTSPSKCQKALAVG